MARREKLARKGARGGSQFRVREERPCLPVPAARWRYECGALSSTGSKTGVARLPRRGGHSGMGSLQIGLLSVGYQSINRRRAESADNPEYQYHLGMAYLAAGSFGPSAQSLQRALSSDPKFLYAENAKAALDTIAKRSRK